MWVMVVVPVSSLSYNKAQAFPGVAGFAWPGAPSLCHPNDILASTLVRAMGCMKESESHALLRRALMKLLDR